MKAAAKIQPSYPLRFAVLLLLVAGILLVLYLTRPKPTNPPAAAVPTSAGGSAQSALSPASPSALPVSPPAAMVRVQGVVLDDEGNPVAEAEVTAALKEPGKKPVPSGPSAGMTDPVATDADGGFLLALAPTDEEVVLRAFADGYVTAERSVQVPKEGLEGVQLVLLKTGGISGRVLDLDRAPVPYVTVGGCRIDDGSSMRSEAKTPTRADGRFLISGVEPGTYGLYIRYAPPGQRKAWSHAVTAGLEGHDDQPALKTVQLVAGETPPPVELVLPWRSSRRITGKVVDEEGKPLRGATVWALAEAADASQGGVMGLSTERSDAGGAFEVVYIPETTKSSAAVEAVDLYAELDGYEEGKLENVPVGSEGAEIVLPARARGRIEGVVLDGDTGRPIPDARVLVAKVTGAEGARSGWDDLHKALHKKKNNVGRSGRFVLEDVVPGSVSLVAFAGDYGMASVPDVEVRAGETTRVRIELAAPGTLRINVIYSGNLAGLMAGNFDIQCWRKDGRGGSFSVGPDLQEHMSRAPEQSPRPIPAGVHELRLQPGTYTVGVSISPLIPEVHLYRPETKNFETTEATVVSGGVTVVDVPIGGTGTVSGSVASSPSKETMVFVTPEDNSIALEDFLRGVSTRLDRRTRELLPLAREYGRFWYTTAVNGEYHLDGLLPGKYTITLVSRGEGELPVFQASKDVTVPDNSTATVDFN